MDDITHCITANVAKMARRNCEKYKNMAKYCCVAPVWLLSLNPFTEFRIWNNSLSSDVLYIQASISPKYESK